MRRRQRAVGYPLPVTGYHPKRYKLEKRGGSIRHALIRELAADEWSQRTLARRYGVTQPAISYFAARHRIEIEALRRAMYRELALYCAGDPAAVRRYRIRVLMDEEARLRWRHDRLQRPHRN